MALSSCTIKRYFSPYQGVFLEQKWMKHTMGIESAASREKKQVSKY
jgi:hypothetical protein